MATQSDYVELPVAATSTGTWPAVRRLATLAGLAVSSLSVGWTGRGGSSSTREFEEGVYASLPLNDTPGRPAAVCELGPEQTVSHNECELPKPWLGWTLTDLPVSSWSDKSASLGSLDSVLHHPAIVMTPWVPAAPV
eukprot:g4108.t1